MPPWLSVLGQLALHHPIGLDDPADRSDEVAQLPGSDLAKLCGRQHNYCVFVKHSP